MPHIVIEVSAALYRMIDWNATARSIHDALDSGGFVAKNRLKTRVYPAEFDLCGDDEKAYQLIAALIMTGQRSDSAKQAMLELVHQKLSEAIDLIKPKVWVQCGVYQKTIPTEHYMLQQWNTHN